ncbi:hypothetical protein J4573_12070 [Actinomadura barringtoniae]|uniref:histidine kinase n=1 Tax=Actinomadura barringtoniae TaxID=1427535 RepID=A0A939P8L6_9ACTN|nr:histidine kinase [Actinomadura barringtoniae]MBO2447830.1 hypothetical protein [Actinomadura barringtoniae]
MLVWERVSAGVLGYGRRPEGIAADSLLAVVLLAGAIGAAALWPDGRALDAAGVLLLGCCYLVLPARRRWPMAVLCVILVAAVPYHLLQYGHESTIPAGVVALFTVASTGPLWRAVLVAGTLAGVIVFVMTVLISADHGPREALGTLGWIVAVVVAGQALRAHRGYVAALLDQAEREAQSREDRALRRAAEERLLIARDLHDLLAHTITLIGVQAGAAAHKLADHDRPVERDELSGSFTTIANACRECRAELRATLTVLRGGTTAGVPDGPGEAVADVAGIADLADAVRAAGIEVKLTSDGSEGALSPAAGLTAYRIAQEALTNVVKHADARRVEIDMRQEPGGVRLTISDDGRGGEPSGGGYGIHGMTERAQLVAGTVTARPGPEGGFTVAALLPLDRLAPQPRSADLENVD